MNSEYIGKIEIFFENVHFLCALKPHNVLSVPSRFEKEDERAVLGRILEKQLRRTMYPVHRLDFEVAGLILFAKTKEAQALLNTGFEKKEIQKRYIAKTSVAHSFQVGFEEFWKSRLAKGKKRAFEASHGKNAETKMRLDKKIGEISFFSLWPITGRSHQLRFEMFKHSMPIDGDSLYGSTISSPNGIELVSVEIDFSKFPNREKIEAPIFLKNELVE